jgi:hypothetical protein
VGQPILTAAGSRPHSHSHRQSGPDSPSPAPKIGPTPFRHLRRRKQDEYFFPSGLPARL